MFPKYIYGKVNTCVVNMLHDNVIKMYHFILFTLPYSLNYKLLLL